MSVYGLNEREERCRVALDNWLSLNLKQTHCWTLENNDPPDIWLNIDDVVYGVEITSIHGNAPSGIPGKTITDSLGRVAENIARETAAILDKQGNPLEHYYILSLGPDWTGKKINRKNVTDYFVGAISTHYIGYIAGKHDSDKPLLDVKPSDDKLTGIGFSCIGPKILDEVCSRPNIFTFTEPHGRLPEMGDGQTPTLLVNAVKSKIEKMQNNHCPKPWILVVEDDYSCGNDSFRKHLPEEANEFLAIFNITKQGATLEYGSV